MTGEQKNAIDNLRSGNYELSTLMKNAVLTAVKRQTEMMSELDDPNDLLTAVKVIETSSKIVGLSPKETQANIQINAINGFEFIELGQDDIAQIEMQEEFEEAEYDSIEFEEGVEDE